MFVHLSRELARAERLQNEVALIVMDIDEFKTVNDTHGHQAGDRALREVAVALQAGLRSYDLCVRYAGDEFIIVLTDCSREAAEMKRRELQQRVADIRFEVRPGRSIRLAASAGVSVFPHDGSSYESLLADADQRMYRDKAARRASAAPPSPGHEFLPAAVFTPAAETGRARPRSRSPRRSPDAPAGPPGHRAKIDPACPTNRNPTGARQRCAWSTAAGGRNPTPARRPTPSPRASRATWKSSSGRLPTRPRACSAALDEFDQARARVRRDAAREIERGRRAVITDLLEVLDNLDRAIASAEASAAAPDALARGVTLVRDQFLAKLAALGVARIDALGARFDAARHEAVSTAPIDDPDDEGRVVAVVKEGYAIGDDLLRPSSVVVGQQAR